MRRTGIARNISFRPSTASAVLREHVRRPTFLEKLADPKDLAPLCSNAFIPTIRRWI
ncbi:hypothetical protein C8F01DRAFT_1098440 [Mycena amicta]|nr:hypothetical protein C8F01DRAFT_1098440 [Mycena amicta]